MGCTACTEPQCLYKSALYLYLTVELYLYSPMGRTACTEPQCLYKGALHLYVRVELYLYSPMGRTACTEPQCLYKRALYVRVELYLYSPMVRTACTEPQCLYKGALYLYLTAELYLYSPYGPYCLHRVSVPVQGCTLPYFIQCIKFVMSICPNFFQALSQIAHALKQATPIQLHLSHFNTH